MKKFLLLTLSLFLIAEVSALSCREPAPLTSLRLAMLQKRFETVGTAKIIDLHSEGLMKTDDVTATGSARKFTTHKAVWQDVRMGEIKSGQEFLLKINATSWMGGVTKFKPGEVITITTEKTMTGDQLELDQDFGCGRNEWNRYTVEDIEMLEDKKTDEIMIEVENQPVSEEVTLQMIEDLISDEEFQKKLPWWKKIILRFIERF